MLLLSGVPATGKSTFGNWLEEAKGYLHVDAERDGRLQELGVHECWAEVFTSFDATEFVKRLKGMNNEVVFNWGFPTQFADVARALQNAGLEPWWFDADHVVARRLFLNRGGIPIADFDRFVSDLKRDWPKIEPIFQPRIVKTLSDDGLYMSPNKIYDVMFGTT